jgi:hypothetical protein
MLLIKTTDTSKSLYDAIDLFEDRVALVFMARTRAGADQERTRGQN